jgi:hypothetical protein
MPFDWQKSERAGEIAAWAFIEAVARAPEGVGTIVDDIDTGAIQVEMVITGKSGKKYRAPFEGTITRLGENFERQVNKAAVESIERVRDFFIEGASELTEMVTERWERIVEGEDDG